ncbi:ankyrin repeat domain-containing protein 26-like, partial [Phoca vitulina]|uniref:ankyrin repeat domain-containing protein 26-like n=1 Tax=Phoca vitulina TaxID=9720 RepID=UPI0013961144
MSEASLEVTSRCRINLEDETQDLRKKLGQIRSQLQEAQDRHAEPVRCIETSKDHVQKLEVENAKLKVTVKKQAGKIEQLQENLLSTSSVSQSLNFCPTKKGIFISLVVVYKTILDNMKIPTDKNVYYIHIVATCY